MKKLYRRAWIMWGIGGASAVAGAICFAFDVFIAILLLGIAVCLFAAGYAYMKHIVKTYQDQQRIEDVLRQAELDRMLADEDEDDDEDDDALDVEEDDE